MARTKYLQTLLDRDGQVFFKEEKPEYWRIKSYCLYCDSPFVGYKVTKLYCSKVCRTKMSKRTKKDKGEYKQAQLKKRILFRKMVVVRRKSIGLWY